MNNPSTSSGLLSSSTTVSLLPGRLYGLQVLTDGTNAATVIVYDINGSSVSGERVLAKIIVAGASRYSAINFVNGVVANKGLRAEISGTGAEAVVYYGIS